MDERALVRASIAGMARLAVVMMLLLFGCAGTVRYWQGWLYLAVFLGSAIAISLWLFRHDRALLERRLSVGPAAETRLHQKVIQAIMGVGFLALHAVPALAHRWGGAPLPPAVSFLGDGLVALGFWTIARVFRANSFTAGNVTVHTGQSVITTGPYALVRHPMYLGALGLMGGAPLALGSAWGLWVSLVTISTLVWRIFDEEELLSRDLPGYDAYRKQTRYRLIPYIW